MSAAARARSHRPPADVAPWHRAQRLGIDTTGLAFGHPGCGAHAPNEHIALRDLARGRAAYAAILFRIARRAAEAAAADAPRDEL
jgi:acetylornithine deacetylase/succinyl-diaminopimelate desuccinylase-like protein